jgi:uncharacterized protein (DUF2252 family)
MNSGDPDNMIDGSRLRLDLRVAQGRGARQRVARSQLGPWDPSRRVQDPLAVIATQNVMRASDLVPIRYARMAASPWTYFRGAAGVMAADLATMPHTALWTQLCGDAHLLNFGLWATPERNLAFDLRDFDETLPGPFEWDLKRLAASLVVAARENKLPESTAVGAIAAAVDAYRARMVHYAATTELELWYDRIDVDDLVGYFVEEDRGRLERYIARQAVRHTSRGVFTKLTEIVDGQVRITEDPPYRVRFDDLGQRDLVREVIESYRLSLQPHVWHLFSRFTFVDVVRQVVGVGSVGMRVYLVLMQGRLGDDPLFLQVKQAGPSVYEPFLAPSTAHNHGARVVNGKRLLQSATDIFAGWTSANGMDFYVRQFRDMKVIPDSQRVSQGLVEFAVACGEALGRAHARSGDAAAISSYIGRGAGFTDAMVTFGLTYADQNERDHAQLVAAIAAGEVTAADQSTG